MKAFWSVVAASAFVSLSAQGYSNCNLTAFQQGGQGGYGQSIQGYCSISEPFSSYNG